MLQSLAWTSIRSARTSTSSASLLRIRAIARSFASDESDVSQKFFAIMDEYKSKNYAQTVPSRFIKDMRQATDANGDNELSFEEIKNMLRNIGAQDKMNDEELKGLFDEIGVDLNGEKVIHVEDMVNAWKSHSMTK